MKTKIENLINGSKRVRRDLSNLKYVNAAKSTSHIGYAGTNHEDRQEIADKVIAENPEYMDVEMFGKKFHLDRYSSTTGKTVWFSTEISLADFILLSGYSDSPFKHEARFVLKVNGDMTVEIQKFSRRNERAQWECRGYDIIDEAFIEIL